MSILPIGTIISFVGTSPSLAGPGWLYCNGDSVSSADYPLLFAAIGNSFGDQDSGNFNLPDLRGYFLRGMNDGTGRDPDADARTAQAANGNQGDKVGSVQGDDFAAHSHTVMAFNTDSFYSSGHYQSGYPNGADQPTSKDGGNETRPKNVNCYYLIYAGGAKDHYVA